METTGSRPSPKLRAFLQTSHSGIHDVASSAASQLRGSLGRQHKSLIVRERSQGEGAKRRREQRGWGLSVPGPAGAPGPFARAAPATASPLQPSINHTQEPEPPIGQADAPRRKLPRVHTNAPGRGPWPLTQGPLAVPLLASGRPDS